MQKRIPLFVVVMIVASLCASPAIAFGPYGVPMSTLEHGQWAWDVGYSQEEKDVAGCYDYYGVYHDWDDVNEVWGEPEDPYSDGYCLRLLDFELDAALASIEYGLCDNWDIFLRLGMAKAKGKMAYRSWDPYKESVDFDWGFAWQVGTNFTICQQGPWTWGGRLQYGSADPDSDSWTYRYDYGEGYYATDHCQADIELYEALAYIGPTYQPSDTWLLYSAIGWQCERMTLDYSCDYVYYYPDEPNYRNIEKGRAKLKHYSAVGLFGAAWMPNDRARVSSDILIGEAGKFGWSVAGQFPF